MEMHKVGNVSTRGLRRGYLKTFITQQKITFIDNKLGPLGFQSDALFSELTWQVLIERYLL